MTIAIIPMLLEALPIAGAVAAGAAACVLIYLKSKKASKESINLKDQETQAVVNTITPPKQDSPELAVQTPELEIEAKTAAETFDEEPMLKRHHLHNIRLMLIATTFPRPTDSVLSRHYDGMIDAKAEDCLADEAKMARLLADYEAYQNAQIFNEEPMLKRHHLHNIRLMLIATTFPRPTDSVLSRYYDEMIDAKAEDCLENEAKMTRLIADYQAYQKAQMAKEKEPANKQVNSVQPKRCAVPEDSTLRRHFLSTLRANIEKTKAPRPTDFSLRRHYDAMINAEIENHLAHN